MNVSLNVRLLVPITAVAFLLGCGKSEEKTPAVPAVPAPQSSAPAAPAEAAKPAAAAVTEAAQPAAAAASTQADSLIEKAKSLMASKQYSDAATILKDLAAIKLTPEQQKIVDALKTQLQQYMATDATKAVGGLLGK